MCKCGGARSLPRFSATARGGSSAADAVLPSLAARDDIGRLLALARSRQPEARAELTARLSKLGFVTLGQRKCVELSLLKLGVPPPLEPPPPGRVQPVGAGPWIVCAHFRENVSWMLPLLASRPNLRIIVYDCGVEPLPSELATYPRFELRNKRGPLAPVPFFYGVFDYCSRDYDSLPDYTLFLHGHDTAWHQKLSIDRLLELLGLVLGAAEGPPLEYANLNDRLKDDWIYPCRSMVWRVAAEWEERLRALLREPRTESPAPQRILEVQAAQAMVHRSRIRRREHDVWCRLRAHAASIRFHSDADLALEGSFHAIFGEPWCRPFVEAHCATLLSGRANELELRAAALGLQLGSPPSCCLSDGVRGFFYTDALARHAAGERQRRWPDRVRAVLSLVGGQDHATVCLSLNVGMF